MKYRYDEEKYESENVVTFIKFKKNLSGPKNEKRFEDKKATKNMKKLRSLKRGY